MLTGCMPSTSLSGSIASSAASKSICGGVGCCTRNAVDRGVVVERAHRGEHVGLRRVLGEVDVRRRRTRAPRPSPASCRCSPRWRRRRPPGSCRARACGRSRSASRSAVTRSANTASATGPPGIIFARHRHSVLGRTLVSVQEVAFAGEHHREAELVGALDVGSSRIDPPGCTTTATPAAAAASMPSGNG